MNVIEARGLTKAYRGKRVVDRLDMRVAQGDIYGFVGKNGAGKSTVMKMVCGLVTPTEGEIRLFGDARPGGEGDLRVGALIEEPGLVPNLTAYENLMAKALASGIVNAPDRCAGEEEGARLLARHEAAAGPGACAYRLSRSAAAR